MHPSRSTVVAILGVLISTLAVAHGGTRSGEPSLSRAPVLQPSGADQASYERKLLVTKADFVRYVFLTNSPYIGDHAVAVYPARNANKASPTGYIVTAMVTPSDSELGTNPWHVVVRRYDAAVPAAMAMSVRELWSTVLARTGYDRGSILCGPMGIFSAVRSRGARLTAVTIGFDEDSLAHAMLELGEQLTAYAQLAPNKRPAAAREIRQRSDQLLQRVKRDKRLTKRCSEPPPAPMRTFALVRSSGLRPHAHSAPVADLVSR
jgi:hypothetical protein